MIKIHIVTPTGLRIVDAHFPYFDMNIELHAAIKECLYCQTIFVTTSQDQKFCKPTHRKNHHRKNREDGRAS